MPRDHYVAKTYLKHFAGKNGLLHAYRKSDGKSFPCRPDDVCHEWDGDVINDFISNPTALGDYRKIFEPIWNPALRELKGGRVSPIEKFAMSGYWANLLVCTPAWRRMTIQSSDLSTLHHLRTIDLLNTNHGKPDEKLKESLAALDSGQFRLDTEPDYVRALHARALIRYAWYLYNSDWIVIHNETGEEFLTSDNPVAFEDQGPWPSRKFGFPRYLPVSPEFCIECDMSSARLSKEETTPDAINFQKPPRGKIRMARCKPIGLRAINRAVTQCADDLVFSTGNSPSIEALVKKYAAYRIETDYIQFERDGAHYFGMHTRVCERRSSPNIIGSDPLSKTRTV